MIVYEIIRRIQINPKPNLFLWLNCIVCYCSHKTYSTNWFSVAYMANDARIEVFRYICASPLTISRNFTTEWMDGMNGRFGEPRKNAACGTRFQSLTFDHWPCAFGHNAHNTFYMMHESMNENKSNWKCLPRWRRRCRFRWIWTLRNWLWKFYWN